MDYVQIFLIKKKHAYPIQPHIRLSSPSSRYVSDHGFNGYKAVCQHKLLAGPAPSTTTPNGPTTTPSSPPSAPRVYPPCLLEWKSAVRHSGLMALAAHLPGTRTPLPVHVHSWMSGEDFAHEALKAK
jgi:myosin-15